MNEISDNSNTTNNNNTKVCIICSNIGGTCEKADLFLPRWIEAMKNLFTKNGYNNNASNSDFIVIGLQEVGGTKKSNELTTTIIENWFNLIRDHHSKINNDFDPNTSTINQDHEKKENHVLLSSVKAEILEVLNSQPTISPEVTIPIDNASNNDNISEKYWHSGFVIENDNNNFTALACCFAIKRSILHTVFRWNWLTEEWNTVEQTKEELLVCTLTNSKYYKHARFTGTTSRKGYLLSRWKINGKELDLMNIHLYHDDSNLVAFAKTPSQYAEKRKEALEEALINCNVDQRKPTIIFGDLNWRLDLHATITYLREKYSSDEPIVEIAKDSIKFHHKIECIKNLTFESWKEFTKFDIEKDTFNVDNKAVKNSGILKEIPVSFAPTYPLGEHAIFNSKRAPGWCDRILFTEACLSNGFWSTPIYNVLNTQILGDHSAVYLSFKL